MLDTKKLDEWVSEELIAGRVDDKLDDDIIKLVRSYYSRDITVRGKPLIGLDIDGTVTFSNARMKLTSEGFHEPLYVTEMLDNEPFCFMTEKAHRMLKILRRNAYVVPVTSRAIEQFSRVNIFQSDTPYAVLNTGGRILVNGEMDHNWSNFIDNKASFDIAPAREVEKFFLTLSDKPWFSRMSHFRPEYVQIKLDKYTVAPPSAVDDIRNTVEEMGWQLSLQGRKLFAIPGFLSKRLGFEEINVRVGADYTMTAGDSTLDISLLEAGTLAYRPNHGELATHDYRADNLRVTNHSGILAGEEILARMLAVIVSSHR